MLNSMNVKPPKPWRKAAPPPSLANKKYAFKTAEHATDKFVTCVVFKHDAVKGYRPHLRITGGTQSDIEELRRDVDGVWM